MAGVVLAVLAVGVAACSSGGGGTTAPTVNPATVNSDVSAVYMTLFNLADKSVPPKTAAIQNGSNLTAAITEALSNPISNSAAGAKVNSVSVLTASQCAKVTPKPLPSPCAKVNYDIDGPATNGQPPTAILPNSTGYAVFVNGKWFVAKETICGLLGLFYQTIGKTGMPPGC